MKLPDRLHLAHLPTPIQHLPRLSRELGVNLYAWRDDLTGFELSGNKVRKLEFLLADALREEATTIVTCGGVHSNHARATVFAARRLGLDVVMIQREAKEDSQALDEWTGNPMLIRMAGARLRSLPYEDFVDGGSTFLPFLEAEAEQLREAGEKPYVIDEGGSTPLGVLGYLRAVPEMLESWKQAGADTHAPDSLVLALGSGGTHAGLVLGFEQAGLDPRSVHAVNVCDDRAHFEKRVGRLLDETATKFELAWSEAPLSILDGHVGDGYGQATYEQMQFYLHLARTEGLLVDPCYTGKALWGLVEELKEDPGCFGTQVLFLHSGGALADFAYAEAFRAAVESA